jgi:Putative MetA-pathway of phenol degradation
MRKAVVLFFAIFISAFSTKSFAETTIGEQFKVFQDAILQRDEIIKTLIKRIELLEGEVKTIKNKDKIKQIVEDSLNNQPLEDSPSPTEPLQVPADSKPVTSNSTPDENKLSLADKAFERQLLDRGSLILPLYASVVDFGLTTINAATDNIIIDGFTIAPVLVIGDIVSERVRKDTTQLSLGWRMGLPYDLQFESSIAWKYLRASRVKADTEEESFYDTGPGDLELGISHQWTDKHDWLPDSLIAVRWKTTTGKDPYEYADPENHTTGSGFDAINLYYTATTVDDPLAFYGGFSYTHNIRDRKNVGLIKPGDTIGFSLGTSLAINLKSSWNLGFSQSWTKKTEFNQQKLSGTNLTTATFSLGFNYTIDQKFSFNTSLGIGLTEDSPDFQFGFNVPVRFGF